MVGLLGGALRNCVTVGVQLEVPVSLSIVVDAMLVGLESVEGLEESQLDVRSDPKALIDGSLMTVSFSAGIGTAFTLACSSLSK